ncbi:LEF-1 [Spodoptera littoralis nucleopolyhedrovirus]|uniref:LEF-1 n=1 Tax=Spodoptera littoralis nuclear polyhedrosis virus TaxID=10456 RepID=M1K400_NPVSL|nr:LEF-1 [Spodoptera littoralis nucleopolyhedrovirus]AGE89976.1 LEF-1 [Spodoptera littoralis nucleopolyhedrovirus]AYU75308.1 LEF-1 late expression factor 1 [Spodoptera littoralis nucleopolyhedrovirus]
MNTKALKSVYTKDRIERMWNAVPYNFCRKWAFFSAHLKRWHHPDIDFTLNTFVEYIENNRITDVHVKAINDGGREWVIDVDFVESDPRRLALRMDVAAKAFKLFYKDNVNRIMFTGNRGLHVWLKINAFSVHTTRDIRQRYYKALKLNPPVRCENIRAGSFIHALDEAIESEPLKQRIKLLFSDIYQDRSRLLEVLFPPVDEAVFCNLNQIRAPYSYNCKGQKFSDDYEHV